MSITRGVLAQSLEPEAHDKVLDNNPDRIGIWKAAKLSTFAKLLCKAALMPQAANCKSLSGFLSYCFLLISYSI